MNVSLSIGQIIFRIIEKNADETACRWLKENSEAIGMASSPVALYKAFSLVPRKIPKLVIVINNGDQKNLDFTIPGFAVNGWSLQKLCRLYLITGVNAGNQSFYLTAIENLFINAEMNELVALYSSLPVLNYPDKWVKRCAEGIRSNISPVLDAIMYHNPYPATWLDEAAWNQLILKAFFTDKDVKQIIGLDERANKALAATLFDYASERKAAGRPVNLQLWRLVGKFVDESYFRTLYNVYTEGSALEKKAALLSFSQSDYEPAKALIEQDQLKIAIRQNSLTWDNLEQELV